MENKKMNIALKPEEGLACRQAATKALEKVAQLNPELFVVTSDARGSVTLGGFAEKYPRQFVEVGIAEQNAVGIASGLANNGLTVFVCGPACFYSARSVEQIKNDIAYMDMKVVILGVSGGVSYGALGSTHHSLHDVALYRSIPNMEVYLPCDDTQTESLVSYIAQNPRPAYIRIGRNPVPRVYEPGTYSFQPGKVVQLTPGNDVTICAAGEMVYPSLQVALEYQGSGIGVRVLDCSSIYPMDETEIINAAKETRCIITVEEHGIKGGLGGAIAELVSTEYPIPVIRLGFPHEFAPAGSSEELFDYYGLNIDGIRKSIKTNLKSK